jgi:hypothetical protein
MGLRSSEDNWNPDAVYNHHAMLPTCLQPWPKALSQLCTLNAESCEQGVSTGLPHVTLSERPLPTPGLLLMLLQNLCSICFCNSVSGFLALPNQARCIPCRDTEIILIILLTTEVTGLQKRKCLFTRWPSMWSQSGGQVWSYLHEDIVWRYLWAEVWRYISWGVGKGGWLKFRQLWSLRAKVIDLARTTQLKLYDPLTLNPSWNFS